MSPPSPKEEEVSDFFVLGTHIEYLFVSLGVTVTCLDVEKRKPPHTFFFFLNR